jgi:hypothetical protein
MSRFANLKDRVAMEVALPIAASSSAAVSKNDQVPASRQGRKAVSGYFRPEMSFALHMLARRQNRSLQAVMAEAFDDILRKHGESPIGD